MSKVAITGATGFLAEELIQVLLNKGYAINAIARNEGKLVELQSKFKQINIFPCPIEDYCLLKKATANCEGIFHLASFKDVILSTDNPLKTVQTNIEGTLNLLKLSVENKNLKFVIATSTDKAAKISSVYGASKFIVENLFEEFEKINSGNCKYRNVRYGNVFYSTSSVLVKWKNSITQGKEVIVTDRAATRFFWTREEAVKFLLDCLETSKNAKPAIPFMKSISIGELLDIMIEKHSNGKPVSVKTIGLQKGENMHEFLSDDFSSRDAIKWSKSELYDIV